VTIPDEAMRRCDLIVIERGAERKVEVKDMPAATRTAAGHGWRMQSFDLRERRGTQADLTIGNGEGAEAWLVMDRAVEEPKANADARLPMPIGKGFRRQTVRVWGAR
jgi:hypothetical protein